MKLNDIFEMDFSALTQYIPQFIGVAGTLSGTVLGWFLRWTQENFGKNEITLDSFEDYITKNNQYAYFFRLFICNHAIKPKYIKNLSVNFYNKNKCLLQTVPRKSNENGAFISILDQEPADIFLLKYNDAQHINLSGLIYQQEFNAINTADKIVLTYLNSRGKKQKLILKRNFSLYETMLYNANSFLD